MGYSSKIWVFIYIHQWQNNTDLISNLRKLRCACWNPLNFASYCRNIFFLASPKKVEIGPPIETRYCIQRSGYLILHHCVSKWQIQSSHRCLKLAFVTQTRVAMLETTGQFQLILGGSQPIKESVCNVWISLADWNAAFLCEQQQQPVHFGCAEQRLENTHHPGAGLSYEPCEQLAWEVLLSLLLAWACRAAFHELLISLKLGRVLQVLHWTGPWVTILPIALALHFLSLVHMADR